MNSIPFTQYLLPDGRTRPITIERPKEILDIAEGIIKEGVYFEAEMLRTGEVSLTAEYDDEEGEQETLAINICENGPGIGDIVDILVKEARRVLDETKSKKEQ